MSDPQVCWDELRQLAEKGSADPRDAAGKIVAKYRSAAKSADLTLLRRRLDDTLLAGQYTVVPTAYLAQHSRWLVVLEGASAAAKAKQT